MNSVTFKEKSESNTQQYLCLHIQQRKVFSKVMDSWQEQMAGRGMFSQGLWRTDGSQCPESLGHMLSGPRALEALKRLLQSSGLGLATVEPYMQRSELLLGRKWVPNWKWAWFSSKTLRKIIQLAVDITLITTLPLLNCTAAYFCIKILAISPRSPQILSLPRFPSQK